MNPNHLKLLKKAHALDRSGKAVEASVAYREFLNQEPKHADAWAGYAGQLLTLGKLAEAQKACEVAREFLDVASESGALKGRHSGLLPRHAEIWARLGLALLHGRKFGEAEEACATALRIDPLNLRAKANLGSIRMAQGRLEEAERAFRQLVADYPHDERIRLLLITCLARTGNPQPTLQEIAKVLQQAPTSFLVHKSVMGPLYSLGCWAEYRAEAERFRRVDPSQAFVDYEQSFMDLLFGDIPQAWERFEARLKVGKDLRPQRTFTQPAWKGEPFAGKTLLVWAEQGLGDTLMFVRYLPLVKALGGRVLLEAQPDLVGLLATCRGADLVIPAETSSPSFDLQVSIMSLPWIFRTELATIPAEVPYLNVPAEVPHWQAIQEALAPTHECTRIGLAWAGGPAHARDHERSLPAPFLGPLAALHGVAWFGFQVGGQDLPPLPNLISLAPLLDNFSDTAYALSGMDLLITVDTSMAHLAGALGIPTLLLLAHQPDYRWMLEREDSPWYPTMRLYRQPKYGDWESVIQQIVRDLTQDP